MSTSSSHEIPFGGVRLRYDSSKGYDELVAALLADIGERPVPINDFATATVGSPTGSGFNPTSGQADSCCSACSTTAP
jgi:hypothetical protein